MPARDVAALELSKLMGVFSHPHRVRIVEELKDGELDVNTLSERLRASHSRISQQLGQLRSHRLVTERREGRHVYYRLVNHELARWVLEGLGFLESELARSAARMEVLEEARSLWSSNGKRAKSSS